MGVQGQMNITGSEKEHNVEKPWYTISNYDNPAFAVC